MQRLKRDCYLFDICKLFALFNRNPKKSIGPYLIFILMIFERIGIIFWVKIFDLTLFFHLSEIKIFISEN